MTSTTGVRDKAASLYEKSAVPASTRSIAVPNTAGGVLDGTAGGVLDGAEGARSPGPKDGVLGGVMESAPVVERWAMLDPEEDHRVGCTAEGCGSVWALGVLAGRSALRGSAAHSEVDW